MTREQVLRAVNHAWTTAALVLVAAGLAAAQGPPRLGPGAPGGMAAMASHFAGPAVMAVRPFRFHIITGAPYQASATAVTTDTLADGNRITRTSVFEVARDSQGRVRRAVRLGNIGPWPVHGHMIFITDPVARRRYIVNPQRKTYTVLPYRAPSAHPPLWPMAGRRQQWPRETLSLGQRRMDGLRVIGRRVVTTIPAGAIGNQAPIQIISERWYSPALHVVVAARHADPRFGDTVYQLGKISRQDPPSALFAPPADYRLQTRRTLAPFAPPH